jgi:hypothetical protein
MDTQYQQTLWAIAREHEEAAEFCAQQEWHNVSVACSYYAVYTIMWLALGDPRTGNGRTPGFSSSLSQGDGVGPLHHWSGRSHARSAGSITPGSMRSIGEND